MWNAIKDLFLGQKVTKTEDLVTATAIVYDQSDNKYVFTRTGYVSLRGSILEIKVKGDYILESYLSKNFLWVDDYDKHVVSSYVKSVDITKSHNLVTFTCRE